MIEPSEPMPLLDRITDALNRSVRPVLAYGFGVAVLLFTYMAYLTPDAFLAIAGMVIGFFFRGRDDEKREERIVKQQGQILSAVEEVIPVAKEEARKAAGDEMREQEHRRDQQ